MSRPHPRTTPHAHEQTDATRIAAVAVAGTLAASIAAWVAGASTLALSSLALPTTSPVRAPRILLGLARHGSEPWLAWPAPDRSRMPHAAIWWWFLASPGFLIPLLVASIGVLFVRELLRGECDALDPRRARPSLRTLSHSPKPGRFPLGRYFGLRVCAHSESHQIVIGPTGSGKTSAYLIPTLLTHPGSALVVSTKRDISRRTIAQRRRIGRVLEWNPLADGGDAWNLLAGCEQWMGALERSEAIVHAARADQDSAVSQFWDGQSDRALAPFLLAAALSGESVSIIYRWIASRRVDEAQRLLSLAQIPPPERDAALLDLRTSTLLSEEDASHLSMGLTRVLAPLRFPSLAGSASGGFMPEDLIDRAIPTTLYLTIPSDEQRRVRILVIALVEAVYQAAKRAGEETPLDPPLLLLIDEAAHTAPLRDLPQIVTDARSYGVRIATAWQDVSQIHHRYGHEQAESIINSSITRIILPGCVDRHTQALVRTLTRGGESHDEPQLGGPSRRRVLDPTRLDGKALIRHGADPAYLLRPAPWFRSRAMKRLAACDQNGPAGAQPAALVPPRRLFRRKGPR